MKPKVVQDARKLGGKNLVSLNGFFVPENLFETFELSDHLINI